MFLHTFLVLFMCPCCILCITYYVTPSSNVLCPSECCLTLSQVAVLLQNESKESDISLTFLPGNHSLQTPLLVENGNSFRMEVMDNPSDDTIIECNHLKGFNLESNNVTDVHISGLQFVGCSSTFFLTRQVWIRGCRFNFSKKTALTVIDSSAYIIKSFFTCNKGGSHQLELKRLAGGAILQIRVQ